MDTGHVEFLQQLTELIAAHGVYALTAILLVVTEWMAVRDLRNARPEDRPHFRKVHTSVLVATLVLVAVSTGVWFYATFVYRYRPYLQGWMAGLTDWSVAPGTAKDLPLLVQQIAPEDFDTELYQNRKYSDSSARDGHYDLGWVLVPDQDVPAVVLTFQHHFEALRSGNAALSPLGIADATLRDEITLQRRLRLDLRAIRYSPGKSIHLQYEPGPDLKTIGTIVLLNADGTRTGLKWDDSPEPLDGTTKRLTGLRLPSWFMATAYAQERRDEPQVFDQTGRYSSQVGRLLQQRLGSRDLTLQLSARRLLVESRGRSFTFIRDTLSGTLESGLDGGLVYHNLATAVDDIAKTGTVVPRELYVRLGNALADGADYQAAATYFQKFGSSPDDDDMTIFRRAIAYQQTGQFVTSNRDFELYLTKVQAPRAVAVAYSNLAFNDSKQGHREEAIKHYQVAMQKDSTFAIPFNNLAYLYAQRGEKLDEALALVEKALRSDMDDPYFKDTKGWVLYKLGRSAEALPLIQDAASKLSNHAEILEHLQKVRNASVAQPKMEQ